MEATLVKIIGKPNDYKLCNHCGKINFYENEECINCSNKNFEEHEEGIEEYIQADYKFYKEEGYTEKEIDNIEIEV